MNEFRVLIRSASSTARPTWAALALALAIGCTGTMGPAGIGTLGPGNEPPAVMRLHPDVSATGCQRWILGIPVGPDDAGGDPVAALVAELLSRDTEATLLSEADVRWDHLSIGVYERQCVTVRGVLARPIRTITIPGGDAHGHHGHEH